MDKGKSYTMRLNRYFWVILILLLSISCKSLNSEKSNSLYSENKLRDTMSVNCLEKKVNLSLLPVESVDKHYFDEGLIYTIKTKDSSYVLLNCLYNSNPDLLTQKEYVVLDSIIIKNDYFSYRGIDTTNGNYWRRDGNISYIKVKPKDTIKYNAIFDDERFLTKR